MTISHDFEIPSTGEGCVVTIGSFDGVHLGHRILLGRLTAMAKRKGAKAVVVTFDPHPRIAMGRAEGMGLLTTIQERAMLLADAGVDHTVVVHFNEEFRSQTYEDFVRRSLVEQLGMVGMIVGYNHRLGSGSKGNYDSLLPLAQECGFEIERVEQHLANSHKVSSTEVRMAIMSGDMSMAKALLGQHYMVRDVANGGIVDVRNEHKLLPPDGLYEVEAECDDIIKPTTVRVSGRRLTIDAALSGDVTIRF